jgi:MPBQ/MSBQ methyltransferase
MTDPRIASHYARAGLADAILAALEKTGKDLSKLQPADLTAVDAFHVRGREATRALAAILRPTAADRIIDVGCAIGGSARYLASEFGCHVTGIDLSADYCAAGNVLNSRVGLADRVVLQRGSALDLPFADASFDAAWTEHVQMNIADKARFCGEIHRVLKPQGKLAFHDIFAGPVATPHYPVPWAGDPAMSFLMPPESVRQVLEGLGFRVLHWEDATLRAKAWFQTSAERAKAAPPSPLGLHLLMGADAKIKIQNLGRNALEDRIVFVEAVIQRD